MTGMLRLCVALAGLAAPLAASAASYEFLAAPQTNLNRIYRLDKGTGEVGACQYGLKEGTIGVTICYPPGEGATAQTPSDYALISSRHEQEAGRRSVAEVKHAAAKAGRRRFDFAPASG